ncbi:ATP-dependent protease subunit HslV [Candidatus Uabimicrobium amorphum]|uniref:ATP-dependent protease subunit HslV n=1 Tax=Uabimicrobium amorphum TaxID=2596890 RepID=A0A5S9IW35_UABAM|nr:ATP-dependent protease subunit HslV [Candidatus Uabimicrobium amorphum]BBM88160.1 ATP-dependent protease subunit HslV [Candidatus Uabimicrobium amorphum]
MLEIHGTTVLCVRDKNTVAMASDGQVTQGNVAILKNNAKKVRKINGNILIGFAGATADAFTLMELFEEMVTKFQGNIQKSAIELAKKWRTDRILHRLDALMAVANAESSLLISGSGDVIEPADGILAIGSGGMYAYAAAKALQDHSSLTAKEITKEALLIAASICVYTNDHITMEELSID